jgi:hypothetical protein
MDRSYAQYVNSASADRIVSDLQTAQHLWPHRTVQAAVERARLATGFCPEAARRAMESLHMDSSRQIGRLRSCELVQLGRAIHRYWLSAAGKTRLRMAQQA